ncbi:MAG: homoserine dehydrogenase [Coriobacteriia bacterium]|nr:homoserine dehydrogenase [Coriobacteriia bacterium]MCL2746043.1 homoserine dehydrogenase [Coriobacteriia bacterium]MCL2870900.1 homoserine dehydrogenase [Coriobacteriia bacterium]
MKTVKVGILGLGVVGGGVIDIINKHREKMKTHAGVDLEVVRAADISTERFDQLGLTADQATTDAFEVVNDPNVDVVVELIGGTGIARDLVLAAIEAGKPVITANKALLATHGEEVFNLADDKGVDLRFEASVGGGIPVLEPLTHALTGNEITRVMGIVNGTTNYMLSRMTDAGLSFDDAVKEAQDLGYAEADPTADVDGFDAAAKIAILASLAFNSRVTLDDVATEGIRKLSAADIEYAEEIGYAVKLLAIANKLENGIDVRVHPTMIPVSHQLASVNGVYNAVYMTGDFVGDLMFFGEGAGAGAAASAVVGDLVEAARAYQSGNEVIGCTCTDSLPIRPLEDLETRYCVRLVIEDRSGVIHQLGEVFDKYDVSIKSLKQRGAYAEGQVEFIFVTHRTLEADMQAVLRDIEELTSVVEVASVLRVEEI